MVSLKVHLKIHCFTAYLFIFILILGFTNPTPLNRNLVPEICKKEIHKDWFVIRLLVYNRFKIQGFIYFFRQ
jgi:hypothetical protein